MKLGLILLVALLIVSGTAYAELAEIENLEQIVQNDPKLKDIYGNVCIGIHGVKFSSLPRPEVSLQKLVDDAEDNDTLLINPSYNLLNSTLHIDKNLTVIGEGLVVADANRSCEILHIEDPNLHVKIDNIVFVNGLGEHGGAIDSIAKNLSLENCTLSYNLALNGSSICTQGDELHIKGNDISYNFAAGDGTIISQNSNITIERCMFTNNTVLGNGSGVFNLDGNIYADRTTFYGNYADQKGGGIYHKGADLVLIKCTFEDNNAKDIGAAVYSEAKHLRLESSAINKNNGTSSVFVQDSVAEIKNCSISGNSGSYNNTQRAAFGGILFYNSTVLIENCIINGNKAWISIETPEITSCGGSGAGIFLSSSDVIINDTFIDNNEAATGGGVFVVRSNLVINRGAITNNTVQPAGSIEGKGGAIRNMDGQIALNGVIIACNKADCAGGAIYNEGTLNIADSEISGNIAQRGGAIYNNIAGVIKVDGITAISGNKAQDGGAIYNNGTIELKGSPNFIDNEAIDTGEDDYREGMGGAIFNAGDMTMENGVFTGNKAISGSAIWSEGNLTDTNSHYYSNHATAAGTIIHKQQIGKALSTLTLNNPAITDNTADQSGGGIYDSGYVIVNGGSIVGNEAKGAGGAIYCMPLANTTVAPKLYLYGTTISSNIASIDGGAIYCHEYIPGNMILNLMDVYISGNEAGENGGAIYSVGPVTIQFDLDPNPNDSTEIYNNIAGINGGGIFLGGQGCLNTNHGKITDNTARIGKGGGVYLIKGSKMNRGNDDISNNTPDNIYQAK